MGKISLVIQLMPVGHEVFAGLEMMEKDVATTGSNDCTWNIDHLSEKKQKHVHPGSGRTLKCHVPATVLDDTVSQRDADVRRGRHDT